MTFEVYDKHGQRVDVADRGLSKLVKQNGLMEADLDQFAITEDGHLIMLDDCGRFCYIPRDYRIKITLEGEI